ncbi:hypothetical protein JCM39194_25490 [Desulfotomaculum varum]
MSKINRNITPLTIISLICSVILLGLIVYDFYQEYSLEKQRQVVLDAITLKLKNMSNPEEEYHNFTGEVRVYDRYAVAEGFLEKEMKDEKIKSREYAQFDLVNINGWQVYSYSEDIEPSPFGKYAQASKEEIDQAKDVYVKYLVMLQNKQYNNQILAGKMAKIMLPMIQLESQIFDNARNINKDSVILKAAYSNPYLLIALAEYEENGKLKHDLVYFEKNNGNIRVADIKMVD